MPLAIAKVFAANKLPHSFSMNGIQVDWNSLDDVIFLEQGRRSIAALLYGIAEGCHSWYFYQGTFTFPFRAKNFFKDSGYKNINKTSYSFDKVTAMIDKGKPLVIYGVPGIKVWNAHAWNIDGYKISTRQISIKEYLRGDFLHEHITTETCKMVHCDFGWGGNSNGYYIDGVFNTASAQTEFDFISDYKSKKYTKLVNIFTY